MSAPAIQEPVRVEMGRLAAVRPDLAARLVNQRDGWRVSPGATIRVLFWCDGTVQGHAPHRTVRYPQVVRQASAGRNACPVCGTPVVRNRIEVSRPDLVARLVDPHDALLHDPGSAAVVQVWCDGAGTHPDIRYPQQVRDLAHGGNACPLCTEDSLFGSIAVLDPAMAARLVDPDEATRHEPATGQLLRFWCDGVCVGRKPHDRIEYAQTGAGFSAGDNACPQCRAVCLGPRSIAVRRPDMAARLVDPADAVSYAPSTGTALRFWCDGTVQGQPAHDRVDYEQPGRWFIDGHNACPVCGGPGPRRRARR